MTVLKRYRTTDWVNGADFPDEPFVFDVRNWDIANTMQHMLLTPKIQNCENLVAVTLRCLPVMEELYRCERAARKGNFRILWMKSKLQETSMENIK